MEPTRAERRTYVAYDGIEGKKGKSYSVTGSCSQEEEPDSGSSPTGEEPGYLKELALHAMSCYAYDEGNRVSSDRAEERSYLSCPDIAQCFSTNTKMMVDYAWRPVADDQLLGFLGSVACKNRGKGLSISLDKDNKTCFLEEEAEVLVSLFLAEWNHRDLEHYTFYAKLDYVVFLEHGHVLVLPHRQRRGSLLWERGSDVLTFHYRQPHEKDPGGLRHEQEQNSAGVGSPQGEGTSASASASGGSPQEEVPQTRADPKARPAPKKRYPCCRQRLIRENEPKEEKKRQATQSEGSTKYAYEAGGTVHGRVDAHRAQQQEELNEVLRKARTNPPGTFFAHGVLHRTDSSGRRRFSTYDYPIFKVTPWHTLSENMRTLLGGEYNWATWMQHPLSGYSLHFFHKAFELGKMQGNYLVEMINKKLEAHHAFHREWEVYREIQYVRDDFSLLISVIAEACGPDFFSYIQRNAQNEEICRKYLVRTPEGYGLYDSTLRQSFNGPYILACLEKTFKAEEVIEPEKETPMDTSEVATRSADLPQGETAGSAKTETPDVPIETEAPESSPQGKASGVKAANDIDMAQESSSPDDMPMPDIAPERDAGPVLHDHGIWGKCENVVDPEAYKVSPMRLLMDQKSGYGYSGLYHTGIRDEEADSVSAFKVQHINWRVRADKHPGQKFFLGEDDLFRQMCQMAPIYERRPERMDYVFCSGDVRSTLDDRLMEKASATICFWLL
ncbi:hypothetical protein AK812_SmicGene40144 [Symbiodinium microadriaticum]|uniref:Uncharacterized protein n=1 Tax=Symbiodinium microadriaticum TaxID=2951 RepID=A0A1Q9C9J6_SYMMI|nr:hypothetical protein AK812_SmicGene40144 [Symbiodinium microadriaticum]CAE7272629.1 unnamed protein product [Symbiodinium sp. KB8]